MRLYAPYIPSCTIKYSSFFLVYKILTIYRPSFLFPALLWKSGGLAVLLVVRGFAKEKFNAKSFWNFPKLWLLYQVRLFTIYNQSYSRSIFSFAHKVVYSNHFLFGPVNWPLQHCEPAYWSLPVHTKTIGTPPGE